MKSIELKKEYRDMLIGNSELRFKIAGEVAPLHEETIRRRAVKGSVSDQRKLTADHFLKALSKHIGVPVKDLTEESVEMEVHPVV